MLANELTSWVDGTRAYDTNVNLSITIFAKILIVYFMRSRWHLLACRLASDPSVAADETIATDPSHVGGEIQPGIKCLHAH